ncbi:hypothetical protein NKI54_32600 [Mesorhizobium sp. M0663]|uniref:hypothetical protein n=1 Tax=unclassified Mesorhizobium TaxID=325217 RepID=UPI0033396566
MNMDYREFKESLADAIEAELALLGPGTLPRRTILSSNNRTRPAKNICAPSDAAHFLSSSSRRLPDGFSSTPMPPSFGSSPAMVWLRYGFAVVRGWRQLARQPS